MKRPSLFGMGFVVFLWPLASTGGAATGGAEERAKARHRADTILHNGRIATMDEHESFVEAVAIRDGKILAVGGNRHVVSGRTLDPDVPSVRPEQRLTRMEALRAKTVNCAWNLAQEGRLGSLEPGKHADLIVLSDDYFTVPTDDIRSITSVLTMVGGRIVHDAGVVRITPPKDD